MTGRSNEDLLHQNPHLKNLLDSSGSLTVSVEIGTNVHGNIRKFYEQRKQAQLKQERTLKANKQALKSAESKIKNDLKQTKVRSFLSVNRRIHWFEKFSWFISTENYLILCGRDMQQNELLVKKYLKKGFWESWLILGDIYVHADIHGAASVVIKNRKSLNSLNEWELAPIPPSTLSQAGCMSICNSKAWDAKVVTSAWWVFDDQVSKTAPSGEYLATGSFMIRGKKNFLPHNQLVYGFGVMFKLHDDSIKNHLEERKPKCNLELDNEAILSKMNQLGLHISNQENFVDSELLENEYPDTQISIDPIITENTTFFKDSDKEEKKKSSLNYASKNGNSSHAQTNNPKKESRESAEQKGPVRGKKGKMKKQMKKYANQDEEERQLKMELLGSKGREKSGSKGNKKNQEKDFSRPKSKDSTPKMRASSNQENSMESFNLTLDSKAEEESESEDEAAKKIENLLAETSLMLDSLTGRPLEDDLLLCAVPVCAPYAALTDFKYKVKLTPGQLKKGKAVQLALSIFKSTATMTQKERELISCIPDADLINQMMAKVKLSAPNMEMIKIKEKAKKKRSKDAKKII